MTAESDFTRISYDRFCSMQERAKKQHTKLPFTLDEFRDWLQDLLKLRGITRCEYCDWPVSLQTLHLDHRIPIAQRGSFGLHNLAPTCASCNLRKGEITAAAFIQLQAFVNHNPAFTEHDRINLWGRLQSQLKLALLEQIRRKAFKTENQIRIVPHLRLPQ